MRDKNLKVTLVVKFEDYQKGLAEKPDLSIVKPVPLEDAAARALDDCLAEHRDDLNEALAPFGLTVLDIEAPKWRRIEDKQLG